MDVKRTTLSLQYTVPVSRLQTEDSGCEINGNQATRINDI